MQLKFLSALWGHEHLPLTSFLDMIKEAGYDGVDTWIPENLSDKRILFDYLAKHEMTIVSHQHRAEGSTFKEFKESFVKNLYECAEPGPLLINSHTGRDHFTFDQNLALLDEALEFTAKTGITVAHETHRGRLGYSPQMIEPFLDLRPEMKITADLSHWVCVTESMLENFGNVVTKALQRSVHIHSRVGFEQGPQIPDPRATEWRYTVEKFVGWWDIILKNNVENGVKIMPITTEFGPEPYMPKIPFSKTPLVNLFEVNCYMKDLLTERFSSKK